MHAHNTFSSSRVAFIQPATQPLSNKEVEMESLRRSNEQLRRKNDELNEKLTLESYFQSERETKFQQLEARNQQLQAEIKKLKEERVKLQSALSESKLAQIKLRHTAARATREKIELNDVNRGLQQKIDFLIAENQRLNRFKYLLQNTSAKIRQWHFNLNESLYLLRRRLQSKLPRKVSAPSANAPELPRTAAEDKWFIAKRG